MNDLTRRRNARDVWISRGHLAAAGSLAVAAVVLSFGVGFLVGRDGRVASPTVTAGQVPDGALVELLARVEASAASDGAVDVLTFPDALRGGEGSAPEVPSSPAAAPATRLAAANDPAEPGDAPSPGAYTVVVGRAAEPATLRAAQAKLGAAGLQAWVGAEIVDGVPAYRLAVGGWPTAEAAAEGLPIVEAAGFTGTVEPN